MIARTPILLALCLMIIGECLTQNVFANEQTESELVKPESSHSLSLTNGYFYRRRSDENIKEPVWPSQLMRSNASNFILDYSSGMLNDRFQIDLAWLGAVNFEADYRCSEVVFCAKTNDRVGPYPNIWANSDVDGIALSKASFQAQFKRNNFRVNVKGGYDQFNLGVFGVNWGFLFPGSYRGAQALFEFGGLTLGYVWADSYRAPWSTEFGYFLRADGEKIPYMHSGTIKYQAENGLYGEAAIGQSYGWQERSLGKLGWRRSGERSQIDLNYQYYHYTIVGEDFIGQEKSYGRQHVASIAWDTPFYLNLKLEYIGTEVNSWFEVPEFIPRMSAPYGNSQGRLDYWWNAVSDFNKHGEQAYYFGLSTHTLALGPLGISAGAAWIDAHNIAGWDANRNKSDHKGYERGYNLDLNLSIRETWLKGLMASIHFTHLEAGGINLDDDPGSLYRRYGLYSTDDLKVMLIYQINLAK